MCTYCLTGVCHHWSPGRVPRRSSACVYAPLRPFGVVSVTPPPGVQGGECLDAEYGFFCLFLDLVVSGPLEREVMDVWMHYAS